MAGLVTYNNYIQRAIKLTSVETMSKLEEFYAKSEDLAKDYNTYAFDFIEQTLKVNRSTDTKKALTSLLLEIGFKNSKISKMIGVALKRNELAHDKSDAAGWYKELPAGTAYTVSLMAPDTFNKVWAKETEWGTKPLQRERAEELLSKERISFPGKLFTPPSVLEKALKLLKDYPDIIAAINAEIDKG